MFTEPWDIFQESNFTPQEMEAAKLRGVEADRISPAVSEIKAILNRIIDRQVMDSDSWEVMINVLKAFDPEVRTYIYKQSMK